MVWLITILQTLFVCAMAPAYWWYYGPRNFLWVSDIAMFVSVVALWREDGLLSSMEALSVLVFELVWIVEILIRFVFRNRFLGLSDYMFNSEIPLWIRMLSLFHVWLPFLLVWMVLRFGYDKRALLAQTIVWYIVVVASYFASTHKENINFVFGVGRVQKHLSPRTYLATLILVVPVCIYLPTHFFLRWLSQQ